MKYLAIVLLFIAAVTLKPSGASGWVRGLIVAWALLLQWKILKSRD